MASPHVKRKLTHEASDDGTRRESGQAHSDMRTLKAIPATALARLPSVSRDDMSVFIMLSTH
jgi:hypothetical protein